MKNFKYLALAFSVGALIMQGCNDFLDTTPTEIYDDNVVWSSQGTVDAFVVNNYASVFAPYLDFSTWDKNFSNSMITARSSCPGEARGLMENSYDWGLNGRFGLIRNCNLIIEKVAQSSVLDDSYKKRYTAEAKMMRAMIYYDLARKGGKFMWVDKVLNTKDDFNIPLTKSIVESYKYVLKDLREAIPNLSSNYVAGRLNRNAGYALLSEICLTAAAYTNNDASLHVTSGKDLYQEAVEAVDAISGVSLDPNYESIFNQNGAYSSPEIILSRYWSKDNTEMQSTDMISLLPNLLNSKLENTNCGPLFKKSDIFECWLEYSPSQNIVDAYLVVDQQTGKAVKWNESTQFIDNTKKISKAEAISLIKYKDAAELTEQVLAYQVVTPGLNISDLMYKFRDKRFDASIIHDGSVFFGENVTCNNYGNMSRWATTNYGADHVPLTNYSTRKYIYTDMSPRPFYNVSSNYHKILFRYGRVLLNKAEALLMQKKVTQAVEVMNQTRTIHGGLPASSASSLSDAWNDYKIERRAELFYEGDFYFSLLRWGKYGYEANDGKAPGSTIEELNRPATFIEINADRSAAYVGNVQMQNDQRRFDVRSYLFPITKSIIQANSAISDSDQNPGWE